MKFGDFEFLNLADLSWNVSKRLVCPANKIGEVDLYQVTHHGGNVGNDPALLRGLRPTAPVMINGPRRCGPYDHGLSRCGKARFHHDQWANESKSYRFK